MRSKKATINAFSSIIFEIIKIVGSFLLPRLILSSFGSNTNGINQAVTQFISYISLLTAGVGSVTTAALYKPIAENNNEEISGIINATEIFIRNVSKIFLFGLLVFSVALGLFINEFNFLFTFSLVLILGVGTFANYYFGLAYRMILNADQKQYVYMFFQSVLLILQIFMSVILINNKASIHTVQLVSSMIFLGNPLFIYFFVRNKYKINKEIEPDFSSISQRWDAFGHQIANFVNDNTDLLLLTLFTNLKEVSVYSLYYLVFNVIRMTIASMVTGVTSAFGNMFATGEIESIRKNLKLYEFFLHTIAIVLYCSMAMLITSFMDIYTFNIVDANYHRPIFGYLLSSAGFFIAVRMPYDSVTRAAGHFKETRNGAIFEAVLNIILSVSLVIPFGMNGLIIGTLAATIFRTIQYGIYSSKHLLDRKLNVILKRYIISAINIGLIILIIRFIPLLIVENYIDWVINGVVITGVGIVTTLIISLIFYYEDLLAMVNFIFRMFKRSKFSK